MHNKMMSRFDIVIDRKNTNSTKWDYTDSEFGKKTLIPAWIADMDFKCPQEIINALKQRCEHGVFGYTRVNQELSTKVSYWLKSHRNMNVDSMDIIWSTGVMSAISTLINILTEVNDEILIFSPVYPHFNSCVKENNRKVITSKLKYVKGNYFIDFEEVEKIINEQNIKVILFCNPHNPVGRVWLMDELMSLWKLCKKNNIKIISDEIHADIILFDNAFNSFNNIQDWDSVYVTSSLCKSFNFCGLPCGFTLIRNQNEREKFKNMQKKNNCDNINLFGLLATEVGCEACDYWLIELRRYLVDNYNYINNFIKDRIPLIRTIKPEGTYLLWIDCSNIPSNIEVFDFFINKALVGVNRGKSFGEGFEKFVRFNMAMPRELLTECLLRIEEAYKFIIT